MGRILRRKSEGTSNEANFYSLISRDTTEMNFGQRRQRYLVDQGYNYQVLLADQLLAGWASTELPEGSEAEREMLEATKASINREAKGSSVGGASEQRKRAKKNHQQKQHQHQNQQQASGRVTATRYTQSGRYYLDKLKSKKRR
jgi:superfamily II DNA or RNA helicase